LTKRGYRPTDSGELEAEYEFQHLTFQEYLAALAVVNGYYAGADQKSSYLDVLENFYDDANKEEVVLLAAAQVNRKEVTQIVESIISRIKCFDAKKKNAATKIRLLRNLLMKIVLDEVQLVEKTRTSIFKTVTDGIIWKGQTSLFRDLLKSTFGEEFRGSLKEGWTPLLSALDFQADEKDDPIGKYFSKIKSGDNDFENWKQMLRTFDYIIWTMDEYDVRIRLERDGYIERMVYLFVSIIMNSTDEQAISYSALCMRSILDVGCKISPTCIPCGFTQKLLSSINREVKNNFTFQLFGVLPVDNENAQKLFWFDCPDEIKQFLSDSLSAVSYGNKEGVFWAAVFAGVWSWDKAETILKKVFVEENDVTRNEMLKKLNQLRVSAESCPSKVEDV